MYSLRVLGGLSIEGPSGVVTGRAAQNRQLALLALLGTAPAGGRSRDQLIGLLSPEMTGNAARHSLSDAVYVLRTDLGEVVQAGSGDRLILDRSHITSDALDFQEALDRDDLERAVALYGGAFLDGFYLRGNPQFEHWVDGERERLGSRYASALASLARQAEVRGAHGEAARCWRRLGAYDPFDSSVAAHLMKALWAAGDPANALLFAREHEARLRDEIGIAPPAGFFELVERLQSGERWPEPAPGESAEPAAPGPPPRTPTPGPRAAGVSARELPEPTLPGALPTVPGRTASPRRTAPWWALAGVTGLGGAIALFGGPSARRSADPSSETLVGGPPYTIVTEFGGNANPSHREAANRLVSDILDQSRVVRTLPRDQIEIGLGLTERSPSSPLSEAVARELAVRGSVPTVTRGRLDEVGGQYSVLLRVVAAEDGSTLARAGGLVSGEDELLGKLDGWARELVAALDERAEPVRSPDPGVRVRTPSLQAFREYAEALRLLREGGDRRGAERLARQAVRSDPSFASAWHLLASTIEGDEPARRHAYEQALELRDRLTPAERWEIEADEYAARGDRAARNRALQQAARLDPDRFVLPWVHALWLDAGPAEALRALDSMTARSPFGPTEAVRARRARFLTDLGRTDSARAQAGDIADPCVRTRQLRLAALADAEWDEAEALEPGQICGGGDITTTAGLHVLRGRAQAARDVVAAGRWRYPELFIAVFSGSQPPTDLIARHRASDPSPNWVTESWTLVFEALLGDTAIARRGVESFRSDALRLPEHRGGRTLAWSWSGWDPRGDVPAAIETVLAYRSGAWEDVVRLGTPLAETIVWDPLLIGWFVADAHEQLGRPDLAAAALERLVTPGLQVEHRGYPYSFAQRRLALLYTELGDAPRARASWAAFLGAFTDPDPEYEWMVSQARGRLERLSVP